MSSNSVQSRPRTSSPGLSPGVLTVVLTVVAGMVMIPLDVTIVAVALARLSEETGAALPVIQWVATGYTLALATVIPAAAWAIARFGARRVFLAAIGAFTIGSALVASSWNVESLIAFRVLQGLGGGFVMPAAMTLTLRSAPSEERGRAMALMGLPVLVGPVFGPVLGGWLLDTFSWRWMFLINLPIGLLALWLGARNLPKLPGETGVRLDIRGAMLLPPAMALIVLGTSFADATLVTPEVLVPVATGVVLLAIFARHALRIPQPLLRVRLLGKRLTGGGAALLVLFAGGYFGSMMLIPLYWQVARGESATTAGLLMMPAGLAAGIAIQLSGRLVDSRPPFQVIGTGIVMAIAGYALLLAQLGADTPAWRLVAAAALGAAGAGCTMLPTMTLATRHLADGDIPSGSTTINVLNQGATSIVTAAVSVLLASALTTRLPGMPVHGVGDLNALSPDRMAEVESQVSTAFQVAFALPVALMIGALVIALTVLRPGTTAPGH